MSLLGWLIPTSQQLFPASSRGFPRCTVPRFFAKTGSFSRELIIPYRVRACHHPTANLRQQLPFLEFRSFSRHKNEKSFLILTVTRKPRFKFYFVPTQSSWFHPQCFTHSRWFIPSHPLRAYFIPQPRLGFPFQGVSPQPSLRHLSMPRSFMTFVKIHLPVPSRS